MKRRRKPKGETGRVLAIGPHIGSAPRRTGAPDWFRSAQANRPSAIQNRKLREILIKLPLDYLKKFDIPDSTIDALVAAGLGTVWALSLATNAIMHKVRLDPRRLTKLRRVLIENSVRVNWSVA